MDTVAVIGEWLIPTLHRITDGRKNTPIEIRTFTDDSGNMKIQFVIKRTGEILEVDRFCFEEAES